MMLIEIAVLIIWTAATGCIAAIGLYIWKESEEAIERVLALTMFALAAAAALMAISLFMRIMGYE